MSFLLNFSVKKERQTIQYYFYILSMVVFLQTSPLYAATEGQGERQSMAETEVSLTIPTVIDAARNFQTNTDQDMRLIEAVSLQQRNITVEPR